MKILFAVVLGLVAAVAFCHDLDFTSIRYDRKSQTLEVITPLSRLIKAVKVPSVTDIDVAVRERLGVTTRITPHLDVDAQADMIHWTAKLEHEPHVVRFDSSTSAARTVYSIYENGNLVSTTVLDEPRKTATFLDAFLTAFRRISTDLTSVLIIGCLALIRSDWQTKFKLVGVLAAAQASGFLLAYFNRVHVTESILEPLIAVFVVVLAVEVIRDKLSLRDFATVGACGVLQGLSLAQSIKGEQVSDMLASHIAITLFCVCVLHSLTRLLTTKARTIPAIFIGMVGAFSLAERLF